MRARKATTRGVLLREILQRAGVKLGKDLRGQMLVTYLFVKTADGYEVIFALPELDSLFTDNVILLADTRDGKPLPPEAGPLQIIVPHEKRHARWVRQVISLTVQRASSNSRENKASK